MASEHTASSPEVSGQRPIARLRVMVVDDEAIMCKMIVLALGNGRYETVAFPSAAAALAPIRDGQRFDVILADVRMPDMSGIEFFEELARHHPEHASRLAFITGDIANPQLQEVLGRIPNKCLSKPFKRMQLRELVESIAGSPNR